MQQNKCLIISPLKAWKHLFYMQLETAQKKSVFTFSIDQTHQNFTTKIKSAKSHAAEHIQLLSSAIMKCSPTSFMLWPKHQKIPALMQKQCYTSQSA